MEEEVSEIDLSKEIREFVNREKRIKISLKIETEVAQSCLTLCDPMDCSLPGSSIMGFPRQEYWNGLPFPSPGNLPNPGIEPESPALQANSTI